MSSDANQNKLKKNSCLCPKWFVHETNRKNKTDDDVVVVTLSKMTRNRAFQLVGFSQALKTRALWNIQTYNLFVNIHHTHTSTLASAQSVPAEHAKIRVKLKIISAVLINYSCSHIWMFIESRMGAWRRKNNSWNVILEYEKNL